MGVELVGPPARVVVNGVPSGGLFVCCKDRDGTILELVEARGVDELTERGRAAAPK